MSTAKSAAQMRLEGHPNKAAIRENPLADGLPRKPRGLGKHASALWDKVVPELSRLGVATSVDETMLEGLCFWWDVWKRSTEALNNVDDFGSTNGARAMNAVSRSWTEFSRVARQFGLTACSRNGITVAPQGDDELDEFLG